MINYELIVVSETGDEIITLAEAKNYIRVDTSADDNLINTMIYAARKNAETFIGRDIVAKERTMWVDLFENFIEDRIPLLFGPVDEVTAVSDANGDPIAFEVFGIKDKSVKIDQIAKNFTIDYTTSGINDDLVKQAILQIVSTYYDNRTDYVVGASVNDLPSRAQQILNGYKYLYF